MLQIGSCHKLDRLYSPPATLSNSNISPPIRLRRRGRCWNGSCGGCWVGRNWSCAARTQFHIVEELSGKWPNAIVEGLKLETHRAHPISRQVEFLIHPRLVVVQPSIEKIDRPAGRCNHHGILEVGDSCFYYPLKLFQGVAARIFCRSALLAVAALAPARGRRWKRSDNTGRSGSVTSWLKSP